MITSITITEKSIQMKVYICKNSIDNTPYKCSLHEMHTGAPIEKHRWYRRLEIPLPTFLLLGLSLSTASASECIIMFIDRTFFCGEAHQPGLNFINALHIAFTLAQPKSIKRQSSHQSFYAFGIYERKCWALICWWNWHQILIVFIIAYFSM